MDELLRIDPEFESKIPPLTEEEYQLLEENILQDGVVLNPLIVWNGCIVDGHNRFRIIQAHPEIKYTVFEKEFPDRYAAIAWICCNQLGRRNLTPQQKKYLIGQRYEAEKLANCFRGNQYALVGKSASGQNDPKQKSERTSECIAREINTSESYVRRAERYAKGVDAAKEVNIDEAAGCGAPTYQRRNSGGRTLPYQNRAPAESPVGVFATGLRFV